MVSEQREYVTAVMVAPLQLPLKGQPTPLPLQSQARPSSLYKLAMYLACHLTWVWIGGAVVSLVCSVLILHGAVRTSEKLNRDWQKEAARQKTFNLARQLESRIQAENLLKLREFGRELDRMKARLEKRQQELKDLKNVGLLGGQLDD